MTPDTDPWLLVNRESGRVIDTAETGSNALKKQHRIQQMTGVSVEVKSRIEVENR